MGKEEENIKKEDVQGATGNLIAPCTISMKKIKRSDRGLTFSLLNEQAAIGSRYDYFIDKERKEIVIIGNPAGKLKVSRKRSGNGFKPLYDIRSAEVRKLCSEADYMQIEVLDDKIVVHTYRKVTQISKAVRSNVIHIADIIGEKTGEIILDMASGMNAALYEFGHPTLQNAAYFESLCLQIPRGGRKKELKQVYTVASLFSGAGLLDYSFRDPRIRFVYAVDFDKDACDTYRENIGNHIVCKDIRQVDAEEVPDSDICIGGPCCQGYSNANRRNIAGKTAEGKRLLIEDYIRIVKAKKPKVFVIENVPQFYTKENGLYIGKVIDALSDTYEITCHTIIDSEVGGYTARKRAIVIGSRIGKIELPSIRLATVKTVRDALSKVDAEWFNYNDVTKPKQETALAMSYVKPGGNWKDIPEDIHSFGKDTHSDRFRRLSWDEVAPTIVNWRKVCMMPPEGNRILSVSEAAALMGLDKDFKVLGSSLGSRQQQIGNGVTQAIGRFVKKYVLEALDRNVGILQFV